MSLTSRNAATISAAIKLGIFTVISILITGLLAVIMGNIGLGGGKEYYAIFENASMLDKGDDVRIAGVSVGEVREIEHTRVTVDGEEITGARVKFRIDSEVQLTDESTAEIRFLNLVGARYLALEEGRLHPDAAPLASGGTIDVRHTKPALDLTVLFDGFKPLFQALTPDQVNELSMNLIQVLQGEGGTVQGLLEHTASLTNSLADRDQLIGSVINNLSETLDTVQSRRQQLSTLLIEMRDWMTDLARDRSVLGGSLDNISQLTEVVADLLRRGRPLLKRDVAALRDLAALLNQPGQRAEIVDLLERMPEVMQDQTRTGTYGSWYQYYVCGASLQIKLPAVGNLPIIREIQAYIADFDMQSTAERCQR